MSRWVEWLPGLQQRLEAAEHPVPSTAGALVLHATRGEHGELGRAFELMGEGQPRDAVLALLDLVRQPGEPFGPHALLHRHPPGLNELMGRIGFEHLAVAGDVRRAHRSHICRRVSGVCAAGAQVVFDATTVPVALGPFRLRDRIPDRLGRCLDVDAIDLGGPDRSRCRGHAMSSSWVLRSRSADAWRSRYLSIHRWWIN